ncbi:MAG: ABC transporter ATP-binding protein [Elusimicrobia bacterium]|nr:ABC transporter ATP-binding protein [Elusimicrobiota bacterium]
MDTILRVEKLTINYFSGNESGKTLIPAVRDVSFELRENETLGVVGESGCGKSTLALGLLKLIAPYEGDISGRIIFGQEDILKMGNEEIRDLRGNKISIIFQDPYASFNPVITVGNQLEEVIKCHRPADREPENQVVATLERVLFPDPDRIFRTYPHQLSGGMLQRAMIAMAILLDPKILIADEPTTALDVTIQREILDLLVRLKQEMKMSVILITHNFNIVKKYTDRVAVMSAGKIVEYGDTGQVFREKTPGQGAGRDGNC